MNAGLRSPDFGLRSLDVGLPTANFGLRTSNAGLRRSNADLRTPNPGLRILNDGPGSAGSQSGLRATRRLGSIPNVGIEKPELGRKTLSADEDSGSGLGSELFGKTQQRVLGLFFGQPERGFYLSELIALAGAGTGAVQREVARLVRGGLVSVLARDGRKVYRANERAPIFAELCSIVDKTSGVTAQLRRALAPLARDIVLAILFGSIAKETDTADSDIDLLVVSDVLLLEDLFRTLGAVEARLGRRINPTLYTTPEFESRRQSNNAFLVKVLSGKHRVLVGEPSGHHGT